MRFSPPSFQASFLFSPGLLHQQIRQSFFSSFSHWTLAFPSNNSLSVPPLQQQELSWSYRTYQWLNKEGIWLGLVWSLLRDVGVRRTTIQKKVPASLSTTFLPLLGRSPKTARVLVPNRAVDFPLPEDAHRRPFSAILPTVVPSGLFALR